MVGVRLYTNNGLPPLPPRSERDTIEITIKCILASDDTRFSSHDAHFKMTPVEVTDDEDNPVGSLGGRFDGVYEILLPGPRSWIIRPQEIWEAVVEADAEFEKHP